MISGHETPEFEGPDAKMIAEKELGREFKKQGWFNGDVLACHRCRVEEGTVVMSCKEEKFFDMITKKRFLNHPPKLIGLNMIPSQYASFLFSFLK